MYRRLSLYTYTHNFTMSGGVSIKANQKFTKNEAASTNVIGAIISLAIMLMVGVLLLGQFQQQADDQMDEMNETTDADALVAYENIKSSSWGAMNLMGMYPWILGAVALLSVVVLIGRPGSGG